VKTILLFALLLYVTTCFSQEMVTRKRRITANVTERYQTVIETNKEIKQGLYQAFYKKTPIASGVFKDNKKTGMWHFFNTSGEIMENFNYNTNTLLAEAAEDSTSNMRYILDDKYKSTDLVKKPIRIGGRYFGYVPYLKLFKLPADMANINHIQFAVILELLVSPGGRLADFKIHIKSATYERVFNINPDLLTDEDKQFVPASINGQAVSSRIFVNCYINDFDDLEMDI
jgi:hypothetical protein